MADTATPAKANAPTRAGNLAARASPRVAPLPGGAAGILGLQHAAGNQAVVHVMRQARQDRPPGTCLCQTCTCDERREEPAPPVQRKANQAAVAAQAHDAVADLGPGQPLAPTVRQDMEQRLGSDFTTVRVHTDARATRSARAVDALAFTTSEDIVFDHGHYAPSTPSGRLLLAHELAHVVQQRRMGAHALHRRTLQRQRSGTWGTLDELQTRQEAHGACFTEVRGDFRSSLRPNTVTIVEFSATWCNPCRTLRAILCDVAAQMRRDPNQPPLQLLTVDVQQNPELGERYAPSPLPQLYIYRGFEERYHGEGVQGEVPEYTQIVGDAAETHAHRDVRRGMLWGGLGLGGAGLVLGIALAAVGVLSGGWLIPAILGLTALGAALGIGGGAGIGALAGRSSDRSANTPPPAPASPPAASQQQPATPVQHKLRVSEPGDPLEAEADAVAQRAVSASDAAVAAAPAGEALPHSVRAPMEQRFGEDFAAVRVRRDTEADRLTRDHGAVAVTLGNTINLAADAPALQSPLGGAVLAHELAHVVQQDGDSGHAGAHDMESEAERAVVRVAAGDSADVRLRGQRQPLHLSRGWTIALWTAGLLLAGVATAGIGLLAAGALGATVSAGAAAGILGAAGAIGGGIGLLVGLTRPRPISGPLSAQQADVLIRGQMTPRWAAHFTAAALNRSVICFLDTATFRRLLLMKSPTENADNVVGFADTDCTPPVIRIDRQRADPGTIVHEGLHAYSSNRFRETFTGFLDEGVTEYFTRRALENTDIDRTNIYEDRLAVARVMVQRGGLENVRLAYFEGNVQPLLNRLGPANVCRAVTRWAGGEEVDAIVRALTGEDTVNNWAELGPSMPAFCQELVAPRRRQGTPPTPVGPGGRPVTPAPVRPSPAPGSP